MERRFASYAVIAVSCLLPVLLLVLAVVQYQWAGRVADADKQRTLAHLESAANLFGREFDLEIFRLYAGLQAENKTARPPLVEDAYLIEFTDGALTRLARLEPDGSYRTVKREAVTALPAGFDNDPAFCSTIILEKIPAVISPMPMALSFPPKPPLINRCIYAKLDQRYLREELIPSLIARHFGKDVMRDYDFTVVNHESPGEAFYGLRKIDAPAVKQAFFAFRFEDLMDHKPPANRKPGDHVIGKFVFQTRKLQAVSARINPLLNRAGVWELRVARKDGSLDSVFSRWRQQNLLISLGVEVLLLASIGFILVYTRRAQKLADQKMQFVAGVSHELRTPVSAIAMLSKNQADGLVSTPDQVRQYGALIHQQGQRLAEMVERTLEYAGIQARRRKPALREVDLRDVIGRVVDARRAELAQNGFEVDVAVEADLPKVLGDPEWLSAAVANLLSNAEKYTRERRWIRISATAEADRKMVAVTIEDRGIGIDEADFEQIFEPFGRGRRAIDAQIPGSGIGLSLVRSTAEAHHGRVTFTSAPDQGSSFTLHLPAGQ